MRSTTISAFCFTVSFLFLLQSPVWAQKPTSIKSTMEGMNKLKEKDARQLSYCDVAIPLAHSRMQAEANKTCQTQETCILCKERQTNQPIYASMYIQPDYSLCKTAYIGNTISEKASTNQKDNQPASENPFQVEIKQSACRDGSTNLEIVILGNVLNTVTKKPSYNFLWTVDGNKAGHEHLINCVCGNEATVRITDGSTGKSVTKTIRLQPCIAK